MDMEQSSSRDISLLTERLIGHAHDQPEKRALCFLENGQEVEALSFSDLDETVRRVARGLRDQGVGGQRALLLFPQSLDYIRAFLGSLYAGVIPVTTSPPQAGRRAERFHALVEDSGARVVITSRAALEELSLDDKQEGLQGLDWLFLEDLNGKPLPPPEIDGQSLAFLQYTSGSTAAPKGVMLSHLNLAQNILMMRRTMRIHQESVFVSWLPLYHDMGLIAMVLSALYNGATCYLMSPDGFVRNPLSWLAALSRYQGTVTAAPDFAFRLCVDRIGDDEGNDLDLSCVNTMLSGAEPIRVSTIRRFVTRYRRCGLRPSSMFSGYGLAESCVYATGEFMNEAGIRAFRRADLSENSAVPCNDGETVTLISCGRSGQDSTIRIVDPDSGRVLDDGRIGEVWVHNPGVGQGYWKKPELSESVFRARIQGDRKRRYLRTGDLGFIVDERLYISGRLKELIITRGRNLHPADVSSVIEDSVAAFRSRPMAVFGVEADGEEHLVVVIATASLKDDRQEMIAAVRAAVLTSMGVDPGAVLLVPQHVVTRTTSGKIQHQRVKQAFLDGRLPARERWLSPALEALSAESEISQESQSDEHREVVRRLTEHVAKLAQCEPSAIHPDSGIIQQGLDSLKMMTLMQAVEASFGVEVRMCDMVDAPSVSKLAHLIIGKASSTCEPVIADSALEEVVL